MCGEDEYGKDLDDLAENEVDKEFEKFKKISAPDPYQVGFCSFIRENELLY